MSHHTINGCVKQAIKALSRDEITDDEYKQRLTQCQEEYDGANWYTVSGKISGFLGNSQYTDSLADRVRHLSVEVDERFANNLGVGLRVYVLSYADYVKQIPGFDGFVEETDNWSEGRVDGVLALQNPASNNTYSQVHIYHNRGEIHRVPYCELPRITVLESSPGTMSVRLYVEEVAHNDIQSQAAKINAVTGDESGGHLVRFTGVTDVRSKVQAKHDETGMTLVFNDGESLTFDETPQIDVVRHSTLVSSDTNPFGDEDDEF